VQFVGRERQPVSGSQIVAVLVGAGLAFAGNANLGTARLMAVFLALTFVVQPLATLGHELGHALAISLLSRRPSLVVVGRGPFVRIKADPTVVMFSLLPTRGVPFSGICRYDPSGLSWRTIMWVALAGPLATLCELIALALAAPVLWSSGLAVRWLIGLTAACLTTSLVVNLWPHRPGTTDRDRGVRRDGPIARVAYARYRTGAPPLPVKSSDGPGSAIA
jgi:hypothetical protein